LRQEKVEEMAAGHTASRAGCSPRRKRSPWPIALAALGLVGVVVGGVYVALLRVPAAPPRTQQIGTVHVTFATAPDLPWTGPATVALGISDGNGVDVTNVEVSLTYDMQTDGIGRPMKEMAPPSRATARMASPGRYVAPVNFTMAGQWAVQVSIERGGRPEGQGKFVVVVR
jgi:hypothetical protein